MGGERCGKTQAVISTLHRLILTPGWTQMKHFKWDRICFIRREGELLSGQDIKHMMRYLRNPHAASLRRWRRVRPLLRGAVRLP